MASQHELAQIIGSEKTHFSEVEFVRSLTTWSVFQYG